MKVYCVFDVYTSSYPEDNEKTLVKIFDSEEKAESFIEKHYYFNEECKCSLQGIIEEFDVL